MMMVCRRLLVCFFVLLGLAAPSPLLGAVAGYSWFVQGDPDVIVQYDFVGNSDAERRDDKSPGTNHLVEKQVGSPVASILYGVAGFDSTSTAVLPYYYDRTTASAFFTSQKIAIPNPVSFEAIICPNGTPTNGYMAGIHNGTDQRRTYFVAEAAEKNLHAGAGNSHNNRAPIKYSSTPGSWYYVAVTMSYDSDEDETTVNTWYADLMAEEVPSLTWASHNVLMDGSFLNTDYLGIGLVNSGGSPVDPWNGNIDEVTLYTGLKDAAFFQANLDRILDPLFVPEPSALVMAVLGLLGWMTCFARRGRRERKGC